MFKVTVSDVEWVVNTSPPTVSLLASHQSRLGQSSTATMVSIPFPAVIPKDMAVRQSYNVAVWKRTEK